MSDQRPYDEAELVDRLMTGIADRAMLMALEQGFPVEQGMEKAAVFFGTVVIQHLHHLASQYQSQQLLEALYSRIAYFMAVEEGRVRRDSNGTNPTG